MPNQVPTVTTMSLMERFLDGTARRQVLRMENLAQIDTPGYKAKDIPFEKYMAEWVEKTEKGQISSGRMSNEPSVPPVEFINNLPIRPDQNNVDMDQELRAISTNVSKFNVIIQVMQQKLRLIRTSIIETRG